MDNLDEAEKIFKEVINLHPGHIRAHQGLIHLYEKKGNDTELCREVAVLANIALGSNKEDLLSDMVNLAKSIDRRKLDDSRLFQLASIFEKTSHWEDAHQIHKQIIDTFPNSPYFPKALFSLGKILMNRLFKEAEARTYFERLLSPPYEMEWGSIVRNYLRK